MNKLNISLLNYFFFLHLFFLSCLFQWESLGQPMGWQSIGPAGVSYNSTLKFESSSERFYVFGDNSLFKSENNGNSWINISPDYLGDSYQFDLVVNNENHDELYFLNIGRRVIYKSTDAGNNWELYYSDSSRNIIYLDKENPSIFIALKPTGGWGNFFQTIEKSYDAGKTWHAIAEGMDTTVGPIKAWINPYSSDNILAAQMISYGGDVVYGYLFYISTNGGLDWNKINFDRQIDLQAIIFDPLNEEIFYIKQYNGQDSISWMKTTNGGNSWFDLNINLSEKNPDYILASPYTPGILYMVASSEFPNEDFDIYLSENGGIEWTKYSTFSPTLHVTSILIDPFNSNEIYICSYPYGIFKSSANGQNWINKSAGLNQSSVCLFSSANSEVIYAGIGNRGLMKTKNGGESWEVIRKNLSSCPGKILVSKNDPNWIFSNDYIDGLRFSVSQDGGNTWISYPCTYNGLYIFDVADDNQTIYGDAFLGDIEGLIISGIIKSSDGGLTWELSNPNIDNINYIDLIKVDPSSKDIVYAVIWIRGSISKNLLIKTSDGGKNWEIIADPVVNFFINQENANYVYYSSGENLYISNNNGEDFQKIFINYSIKDLVSNKLKAGELYAITYDGKIIKSNDYGYNWVIINKLQKDVGIQNLQLCNSGTDKTILFASTWYNGILKYEIDNSTLDVVTTYADEMNFYLYQNYPNPFNPSTKINYEIPAEGNVTLKIYDIVGNELTTLLNDYQKAGRYEVEWNAKNFASGIYIYQLKTNGIVSSRKLILLK